MSKSKRHRLDDRTTYRNVDQMFHCKFDGTWSIELRNNREVQEGLANSGDLLEECRFRECVRDQRHDEKEKILCSQSEFLKQYLRTYHKMEKNTEERDRIL